MTQIAACSLLLMCIQLFINPYVMYGFTQVKYFSSESFLAKLYFVGEKNDYSQEWINNLSKRFNQLDINKSYLKAGYSIKALQEELKIPNKSVRYYFNHIAGLSFTDWKNNKRIEYAIQLIKEGYLQKYTREHLAKECGFLSRSNFNQAIKKFKEIK
jgi:AraC-like DNA-binding protein